MVGVERVPIVGQRLWHLTTKAECGCMHVSVAQRPALVSLQKHPIALGTIPVQPIWAEPAYLVCVRVRVCARAL